MSILSLAAIAAQFVGAPPTLMPTVGGLSGTEFLTLTVSASGEVIGCDARLSTGAPIADDENCTRLRRATMAPARDDAGMPVAGVVTVMQDWGGRRGGGVPADVYMRLAHLPAGVAPAATSALTLVADRDGRTESCAVARSSGSAALDGAACRTVGTNGLTSPIGTGGAPSSRYVRTVLVGYQVGG